MRPTLQTLFLLLLSVLLAGTATAENSSRIPGYTIHHNAVPTGMLTPEIASRHGIVRSKYRGLLNISVIRDQAGTTGTPVSARVQAYSTNLLGKRHDIVMKEVREGEAIYYLGDFPIVDGETLTFHLEVLPDGTDHAAKASMSQQFFID